MQSVQGIAIHAMASARNMVRTTAVFQIERIMSRSFGAIAASDSLVGSATTMVEAMLSGSSRRAAFSIVLSVTV